MRLIKTILQSALWGWLALIAVHVSAGWTGIGLGFSWLSCGTASVLGLPGVITLMLMNVLL